jgi:MYXO-CTERM domain-containing protein
LFAATKKPQEHFMIGIWLSVLTAAAFHPDPDVYIGIEPSRIYRFHLERQAALRSGGAWGPWAERGWNARFDEVTGTPQWAWGPSIKLGSLTNIRSVESAVRGVFAEHPDVLGVPADQLKIGRSGYVESQDAWLVHFDQVIPGTTIPVWRSGVRVRIKHDRLIGFGVETHAGVREVSPVPSISERAAERLAIANGPAGNGKHTEIASRLMVLPREEAGQISTPLVWEVRSKTETPKGHWVSFVDAHSGELLNVHNEVRFMSGTVSAEHDVRTVNGDMAVSPMTGMRVQTDSMAMYTDDDGSWTLDTEETPEGDLIGEFLRVRNEGGADAEFAMLSGDVTFSEEDATQAELDSWIFQGQIREWAVTYAPDLSMNSAQLDVFVNIGENCNAYFDGTLNFYQAGSGCNNTGRIADVSFHEWGHGFHYYSLVSGEFDGSISEGIGDSVAVLNTGDPVIAPFFFTSGGGIREVDSNRVYPDDVTGEVHSDGLIFGGALWDLWQRLEDDMSSDEAFDTVSYLLAEAIKAGPTIPQSFDEFIAADDDNGDLSDGTPNTCAIIEAFSQHGLGPAGDAGSLVQLVHEPVVASLPGEAIAIEAAGVNLAPECVEADLEDAMVQYRVVGDDDWETVELSGSLGDLEGAIPAQEEGAVVEYFLTIDTGDGGGISRAPAGGYINPFTVYIGSLVEVYCEDFEADDGGYTHELLGGQNEEGADDWMWGVPLGMGGDPAFAASGDKVWGNDLGGGNFNGEYQNSKHNRLTSVEIPLTDATEYVLSYRRWLNVEDGLYDQANVLANEELVWTNHATGSSIGDEHHQDDRWMVHSIPFEAEAGSSVEIAWDIESDGGLTMGGWTIDDVCIYAVGEAEPVDPGEEGTEGEEDAPGGGSVAVDGPLVLEGGAKGCSCASTQTSGSLPWFGVFLTGLIAAGRRRQR